MNRKEVNNHLDNYIHKDQILKNNWSEWEGMSAAQKKAFKLCSVWAYVSPVVKFIVRNKILKFLTPKWVVALNLLIMAFDSECELPAE